MEGYYWRLWDPAGGRVVVVLCGVCRTELTIEKYMDAGFTCPACGAAFNPGCAHHYHLYFGK